MSDFDAAAAITTTTTATLLACLVRCGVACSASRAVCVYPSCVSTSMNKYGITRLVRCSASLTLVVQSELGSRQVVPDTLLVLPKDGHSRHVLASL